METEKHYWVVTCKNAKFHIDNNPFAGHRIPLVETTPHAEHPGAISRFVVRCDECGMEYSYEGSDVIKWMGKPDAFTPHPRFT